MLSDNDTTLMVDVAGLEPGSGDASVEDVACVLVELRAPRSVLQQMDMIRAIDGMQTANWGDLTAQWTYHPDAGLNLLITAR